MGGKFRWTQVVAVTVVAVLISIPSVAWYLSESVAPSHSHQTSPVDFLPASSSQLNVSLSIHSSSGPISIGDFLVVLAQITAGGTPVSGAVVSFSDSFGESFSPSPTTSNATGWAVTTMDLGVHGGSGPDTISATASDTGYTTGVGSNVITVLGQSTSQLYVRFSVQTTSMSGGGSDVLSGTVAAYGGCSGACPVSGVTVELSDTLGATFASRSLTTDSSGQFWTNFTVPNEAQPRLDFITASVSDSGYSGSASAIYMTVNPPSSKNISVSLNEFYPTSGLTAIGATMVFLAHVTAAGAPVNGATVSFSDSFGESFTPNPTTSNSTGWAITTADYGYHNGGSGPDVVSATASEVGYATGVGSNVVNVLGESTSQLFARFSISTRTVTGGDSDVLSGGVGCYGCGGPISGAHVTLSDTLGATFAYPTLTTNSSGEFSTEFIEPAVEQPTPDYITASVSETGYSGSESSNYVNVTPSVGFVTITEGGLPPGTSWSAVLNGSTLSSTGPTIVFSERAGTYSFTIASVSGYSVTPQAGHVTVSNSSVQVDVQFLVIPTVLAFYAAPTPDGVGQLVAFGLDTRGFVSSPTYAYSGLPPGCPTENASWFSCTPTAVGSYDVTVTASDAAGQSTAASTMVEIVTDAQVPIPQIVATPADVEQGQPIQFSVSVSGGTPPYTYFYEGQLACVPSTLPQPASFACPGSVTSGLLGEGRIGVSVIDSNGVQSDTAWVSYAVSLGGNWIQASGFQVSPIDLTVQAACSNAIEIATGICSNLALAFNGDESAGATAYFIQPSEFTEAGLQTFSTQLGDYFGVKSIGGYTPQAALLIHVPFVQDISDLFRLSSPPQLSGSVTVSLLPHSVIPTCPTGSSTLPCFDPAVTILADGSVNVLFVLGSQNAFSSISSTEKVLEDIGVLFSQTLESVLKQDASSIVNILMDGLTVFLDSYDVSVYSLTSSIFQGGAVGSYLSFDLDTFSNSGWPQLINDYVQLIDLVTTCTETGVSVLTDVPSDVQCVVTAVDTALDQLGQIPQLGLGTNTIYQNFVTGFDIATSWIDPGGSLAMPLVRNSQGQVVLGFDPSSGSLLTFSGSGFMLITNNRTFIHLWGDQGDGSNYSLEFVVVGDPGPGSFVPYSAQVLGLAPGPPALVASVGGALPVGEQTSLPLIIAANDSLSTGSIQHVVANTTSEGTNAYHVKLTSRDSSGLDVELTSCLVVAANQTYTLQVGTQGTCEGNISFVGPPGSVLVGYAYSATTPGGIVAIVIPIGSTTSHTSSASPSLSSLGIDGLLVSVGVVVGAAGMALVLRRRNKSKGTPPSSSQSSGSPPGGT